MDLFVINRHAEEAPQVTEEEEKAKLAKVLRQIERKKQSRQRQREREKEQQVIAHKARVERQRKRDIKEKIIPVPDNQLDEFIPPQLITSTDDNKKSQPARTFVAEDQFTVLGADSSFSKKAKVQRVLPKWLAHPTVISSDLQNLTAKASKIKLLDKSIRDRLKTNGIKYLFPVQATVIPWLLQANRHSDIIFPRDICVSAPTGSGKTLAFVLPVVQALKDHLVRRIRALVILPTQDLAAQVFKSFKMYTQDTNLETCLITGKNLFENEQRQLVYTNEAFGDVSKVDILVCTAGRLVNHLKMTKGFSLKHLEFLIIDEADRVLESVQDDWLYHLEQHIYQNENGGVAEKVLNLINLKKHRPPQKLLFSATMSQDPEKLQKLSLFQPKLFTSVSEENYKNDKTDGESLNQKDNAESQTFVGKYTTPRELSEKYIVCSKELKPLILYKFIKEENLSKTIIFTHSIESAHRLSILLKSLCKKSKLKVEEISSSLKGTSREELIARFSNGDIDLLICTDSLARGIDLPQVKCVISYSAPKYLKTYIHRAGRTARAGELGLAVTILHKEQLTQFKALLNQSNKTDVEELKVNEDDLESLERLYKKSLTKLKDTVKSEEQSGLKKIIATRKSLNEKRKVRR